LIGMQLRFAVLSLLAACSIPAADAETESSDSYGGISYSCQGVTAGPQLPTADATLLAPWHQLNHSQPDASWSIRIRELALAKLPVMTTEERVRLQHEVLPIAHRLKSLRDEQPWNVNHQIAFTALIRMIRSNAPTAAELDRLGSSTKPRVTSILGTQNEIVERATRSCVAGSLIHVTAFRGLLAFRPLRTETARALVSQLVTFDRDGTPHITPLVEGIEMRLGNDVTSPACVVQAGLDGTLHPMAQTGFEEHAPFVQRHGNSVGCAGCHHSDNTFGARDLTPDTLGDVDAARTAQVERLANSYWKTLVEPQS
jgi:hypothetical protein